MASFSALLLVGMWVLNLAISIFNAVLVGKGWVESKHAGGLPRFMAWCGATMAAVGFTWCISIPLGLAARALGWLDDEYLKLFFDAIYVAIVPPLLGAGIAITIRSWAVAYRGSIGDKGIAAYNTFAQVYNTYQAVQGYGDAFSHVFDQLGNLFSDDDDAGSIMVKVALVLAVAAAGLGIVITWLIIRKEAAAGERMPRRPLDGSTEADHRGHRCRFDPDYRQETAR